MPNFNDYINYLYKNISNPYLKISFILIDSEQIKSSKYPFIDMEI